MPKLKKTSFECFPMLQLEREEADFALPNFICNSGRAKFAVCHPGVGQWPMNWWTRSILHLSLDTTNQPNFLLFLLLFSPGTKTTVTQKHKSSQP